LRLKRAFSLGEAGFWWLAFGSLADMLALEKAPGA